MNSISKIKQLFNLTKCNTIFIAKNVGDTDFSYFTELPMQWFEGATLILKKRKKPLIVCSSLENKWIAKKKGFLVTSVKKKEEYKKLLKKELSGKKIGVNKNSFSCKGIGKLKRILGKKKLVSVEKEIEKLMEIKTKKEIALIRKACKITMNALKKVPVLVKKGISEKELALQLEFEMRRNGAEGIAFPPICASGKNAGIPHFIPSEKRIGKGFLLVDLGARYKNYCADVSRTFFVGKASEKEKEIYAVVQNAKKKAEELLLDENVSAKRLHLAAEKELKKAGFELVHSLGHGIGLKAHDFPARINAKANFKLKEGMVFTLEPGIYNNKMGIRIEDTYLKTKKGIEKLSKFSEKLTEI